MEWVEDVFYGAVTKGVNVRTAPSALKLSRLADVLTQWFLHVLMLTGYDCWGLQSRLSRLHSFLGCPAIHLLDQLP